MTSIAYVEQTLKAMMVDRATVLARESGCVKREREFTGATLVQTFVFSWQQQPEATLEQMASIAQTADVSVSDTAVHKRFTPECAQFLRQMLEELSAVVIEAAVEVPIALLKRFRAVVLEDSSVITLPEELAAVWPFPLATRCKRPRPA